MGILDLVLEKLVFGYIIFKIIFKIYELNNKFVKSCIVRVKYEKRKMEFLGIRGFYFYV